MPPLPLIIDHGRQGSIAEFMTIVEPLVHRGWFGGTLQAVFKVLAPSLQGYGLPGWARRPWGRAERPVGLVEDIRAFARGLR